MLQPHSFLWHYLWVGPNVLLLVLALLLRRLRVHERYTFFIVFAVAIAIEQLTIYVTDVIPAVSPETWWRVFWAGLMFEGLLKFALVGEIFAHIFDEYHSVAALGKFLIRAVGITLVLTAAIAAAYAPADSLFGIVSGAHLLEQTIYLIESGLLVFIFLFSAYFSLRPTRPILGIALGLAASACVHLATWGIVANGGLPESQRVILDFVNMAAYHFCVLIWFFFLLVPQKVALKSAVALPENNLEVWNRELERLVHL